jgi:hypothetical protein
MRARDRPGMTRSRGLCERRGRWELPPRRARCRRPAPRLLREPERLYVASAEGVGRGVVDVVDGAVLHVMQVAASWPEVALVLLEDATGHPPEPATAAAFADEVLARQPPEGFAITSGEVGAWLLIRALERTNT